MDRFLIPKSNNRVAVVGPTGSGKTVLARFLLSFYSNVIAVDPKYQWVAESSKHSPTGYAYPNDADYGPLRGRPIYYATDLKELREAMDEQVDEPHHILYQPPREHLLMTQGSAEKLDEVAALVLERGHTTLYYDELYYVANGSDFQKRAPNYFYCVTTGRSKKIGVWASVQRPSWIPLIALTETDIRCTFFLRHVDDRKRMEKLMGDGLPWDALRKYKHSFVEADDMETTKPLKLEIQEQRARALFDAKRRTA